jgi:hypothetical protein
VISIKTKPEHKNVPVFEFAAVLFGGGNFLGFVGFILEANIAIVTSVVKKIFALIVAKTEIFVEQLINDKRDGACGRDYRYCNGENLKIVRFLRFFSPMAHHSVTSLWLVFRPDSGRTPDKNKYIISSVPVYHKYGEMK